jgi:hypothetical protein
MFKITLTGLGLLVAIAISSSQVMAAQSFQDPIKNTQKLTHTKADRQIDSRQARADNHPNRRRVKRTSGVRSIRQRQMAEIRSIRQRRMAEIKNQYMINQMRARENTIEGWRNNMLDYGTTYGDR